MVAFVKENEDEFIKAAMDNSVQKQSSKLTKAKKALKQAEKRIIELDRLFTRLYEDNVSGKISDERFSMMYTGYEDDQKKLRATVTELTVYLDTAEQKSADVTAKRERLRNRQGYAALSSNHKNFFTSTRLQRRRLVFFLYQVS